MKESFVPILLYFSLYIENDGTNLINGIIISSKKKKKKVTRRKKKYEFQLWEFYYSKLLNLLFRSLEFDKVKEVKYILIKTTLLYITTSLNFFFTRILAKVTRSLNQIEGNKSALTTRYVIYYTVCTCVCICVCMCV